MRIGYACINESLACRSSHTFRLKSYSEQLLIEKIRSNLSCLREILEWNVVHSIFFFRISSDLIPFASHPVCTFPWPHFFRNEFHELAAYIKKNAIRVAMHPDQFVLINAIKADIIKRSIAELEYHARVLDLLECDETAKIQIHVGGVYGDKPEAVKRFCHEYNNLPHAIQKRLVIENDERSFCLKDILAIHESTAVPLLLDSFHHTLFNNSESLYTALELTRTSWRKKDGLPVVDFSTQKENARFGSHALHLDVNKFGEFLLQSGSFDFDIMLEIKDKEKSAQLALKIAGDDPRLFKRQ